MKRIAYILLVFACLLLVGSFVAYAGRGEELRILAPKSMNA
jgi:hypothetical protein